MSEKLMLDKSFLYKDVDGWKYVILIGVIIVLATGLLQITSFGIIYGSLLERIGNEAEDTSTINSVFTMMVLLAGLPANQLLQKFWHRKVTLIGAVSFCLGTFLSAFVTSATQLVFTFGVLQGFGWGLMVVSSLVIFTEYFNRKRNFYINVGYLSTSAITISFPSLSMLCSKYYGYRGTVLLVSALNLHLFCAALCYQPVKWHMKHKIPLEFNVEQKSGSLIEARNDSALDKNDEGHYYSNKLKSRSNLWNWCYYVYETFDLALFKDPIYVNVAVGVSLVLSSDAMYISFLPLLLANAGFADKNLSLLMTVYVVSDLIGKIFICVLTAFVKVKNRYLLLIGAIGMAIFRLGHTFSHSFSWTGVMCSLLGFVRSFVENTTSLVFADMYPQRFVTSLSLSMVVNAAVIFLLGQIIRVLTNITNNKEVILVALSISAGCCAILWIIEFSYLYVQKKLLSKS